MFDRVIIDYNDIVKNEKKVLDYTSKFSDCFSILAIIKKPYSQNPPVFKYSDLFYPYATKYIYDKKDRPINFLSNLKHQIMIICDCCKGSRKMLIELPNIFIPLENDLPEDVCFFRNGIAWFVTISHEKMAFMQNPSKADLDFLSKENIKYYL
jgi:hypothetical protein